MNVSEYGKSLESQAIPPSPVASQCICGLSRASQVNIGGGTGVVGLARLTADLLAHMNAETLARLNADGSGSSDSWYAAQSQPLKVTAE